MKLAKILSILAIIATGSQAICGFYLVNHPELTADGGNDFHKILGMIILVIIVFITVIIFRKAKKYA
jgi:hypothetical protein